MDHPIPAPPETSGKATGSLIAGIIGVLCIPVIPGIVAVVLGHMALSQIKRSNGRLGGGGLAVGGLVTGYIGVLLGLTIVLGIGTAIFIPAMQGSRMTAKKTVSLSNIHQLLVASQLYSDEHEDTLPGDLTDLDPYLGGGFLSTSPLGDGTSVDYVLLHGGEKRSSFEFPMSTVIVEDLAARAHSYRLVGYADGSVEEIDLDGNDGLLEAPIDPDDIR
ncbi:MAG: hypothetical protein ACI9TH_003303 [Kiritimatiellia bacterium]|jgi:hypothetical protein